MLSPLLSGISTVCLSIATETIDPLLAAGLGALTGGIILALMPGSAASEAEGTLPALWRERATVARLVLCRGLIAAALFTVGLHLTSAAKAVFLTKVEPYFVLFWGWVLAREKVAAGELVLLSVHLAGACLLSMQDDLQGPSQWGDLLIVLAMAASGYSYRDGRALSSKVGARLSSAAVSMLSGVILTAVGLLLTERSLYEASGRSSAFFLANVLLFYVASMPLWFVAVQGVRGWAVSALRALGPIAGLPAAYLLTGETLNGRQLAGGLLALVTSAGIGRAHRLWAGRRESSR